MAHIYGYESPQEMLDSITDIRKQIYVNPLQRAAFVQGLEKENAVIEFEAQNYRKDGSIIWITCNARAVREKNGELRYYEGTITDITERKQAEEEIYHLNTELEQRVIERTAQLEESNKELESFSYSVSHDLRTPLRAIDGYSRILQDEYAQSFPPDAVRLLESVRTGSQQMSRLIDDLLKFSRLSRLPVNKQPVEPYDLIQRALNMLEHEQKDRQVEITIGPLPTCQGDPSLLLQVWINLLANALKFSRLRTPARIEIGFQSIQGEPAYYVKDNGVGFDMQYADKLFGVFQRLHSTKEFEGTGVGLALVQRIIARHGGKIWAEAQPGQGAAFYFTV
jgi:PAS domain S-box-containing protein